MIFNLFVNLKPSYLLANSYLPARRNSSPAKGFPDTPLNTHHNPLDTPLKGPCHSPLCKGGQGGKEGGEGWGPGVSPLLLFTYRQTCVAPVCRTSNFVALLANSFCQTSKLINPGCASALPAGMTHSCRIWGKRRNAGKQHNRDVRTYTQLPLAHRQHAGQQQQAGRGAQRTAQVRVFAKYQGYTSFGEEGMHCTGQLCDLRQTPGVGILQPG
eukprot:1158079-Pelagomonas_calceolata.AAC.3